MKAFRLTLVSLGVAGLFAIGLAISIPTAQACPGQDGDCAGAAKSAEAGEKAAPCAGKSDDCGGCKECEAKKAAAAGGEKAADCDCPDCEGKTENCAKCEKCAAKKAAATPCGKADGSCGCGKGAAAKPEAESDGKPESSAGDRDAKQIAVLDPATGVVVAPTAEQAQAVAPATARRAAAPPIVQHADGGVQAAFPANRESRVVASVGGNGVSTNCGVQ